MTRIHDFGESNEMYLKAISELDMNDHPIPVPSVAERLGVATVSASEMVHRLKAQGLVDHQPYKGVHLTAMGQAAAANVVRLHRLWECFLVERLGIGWVAAHDLACSLEHLGSLELGSALDDFLGRPALCPHGNPIPRSNTEMPKRKSSSLACLHPLSTFRVAAVFPESRQVLESLSTHCLLPGTVAQLLGFQSTEGMLPLAVDDKEISITGALAAHVWVDMVEAVE